MIGNHRLPGRVWVHGWVALANVAFALAEKE